jgi:hypothetical protein
MAKKGAKRPIFEGNMPPKKMYPKSGANIGAITGILLRDTHRLKKEKNETTLTFAVKKEIFRPLTQSSLID